MSVGALGNVHAGYRGIARFSTVTEDVRFADANITARQEINAPDLIMGDWDHDAYVFGKIEVGGSISGPVTETFADAAGGLFPWAVKRNGNCGTLDPADLELWYYCGTGTNYRSFTGLFCNSIQFSCAAGDVAQFSIDVVGTSATALTNSTAPQRTTAEKLVTWDKVGVTITAGDIVIPVTGRYSNFDFTIANNVETVYGLGQTDLFPFDIVPGLRTITGSLSVYNTPNFPGANDYEAYCADQPATISFSIGGSTACGSTSLDIDMKVRFHRIEPTSAVGPIVSTVAFTGVTHQTGSPWE